MPRILKYAGLAAALLLALACMLTWVTVESRGLSFSGLDTTGSNYGKPGYFHILLASVFVILTLIPRIWAKRTNLIVVAINLAWAIRNFFLFSACQGGECPTKEAGIFLLLVSSVLLLVSALFPDMKLRKQD